MKIGVAATVAALVTVAPLRAQPAASTTYIHAGRLLDRPGKPPRGPSTIVVRDGKIVEVRDGHQPAPAGAALIDLADRFVLPRADRCPRPSRLRSRRQ